MMTDGTDDWTRRSPTAHSTVTELGESWDDLGCNSTFQTPIVSWVPKQLL